MNGIECQQGETNAADTQHFTAAAASRVESSRVESSRIEKKMIKGKELEDGGSVAHNGTA